MAAMLTNSWDAIGYAYLLQELANLAAQEGAPWAPNAVRCATCRSHPVSLAHVALPAPTLKWLKSMPSARCSQKRGLCCVRPLQLVLSGWQT